MTRPSVEVPSTGCITVVASTGRITVVPSAPFPAIPPIAAELMTRVASSDTPADRVSARDAPGAITSVASSVAALVPSVPSSLDDEPTPVTFCSFSPDALSTFL